MFNVIHKTLKCNFRMLRSSFGLLFLTWLLNGIFLSSDVRWTNLVCFNIELVFTRNYTKCCSVFLILLNWFCKIYDTIFSFVFQFQFRSGLFFPTGNGTCFRSDFCRVGLTQSLMQDILSDEKWHFYYKVWLSKPANSKVLGFLIIVSPDIDTFSLFSFSLAWFLPSLNSDLFNLGNTLYLFRYTAVPFPFCYHFPIFSSSTLNYDYTQKRKLNMKNIWNDSWACIIKVPKRKMCIHKVLPAQR